MCAVGRSDSCAQNHPRTLRRSQAQETPQMFLFISCMVMRHSTGSESKNRDKKVKDLNLICRGHNST